MTAVRTSYELPELFYTFRAHVSAPEFHCVSDAAAENAGRLIFAKNNTVTIDIYLNRVLHFNTQTTPELNRQDNTSKLVYFADDAGGFHCISLLFP